MRIDTWLRDAAEKLKNVGIRSHRLDAELLLSNILGKSRTYLHGHGEESLSPELLTQANGHLKRRTQRTPLAYILGSKEFYGRTFTVSPYVLIPRPETETLIELVESLELPANASIADIGTGSGAIAITVQLNQPTRHVIATDVSPEALALAQQNADALGANVVFLHGDLAAPLRHPVDVIAANLPYVDPEWERSPETDFEPKIALFADEHGLELVQTLIGQSPAHLTTGGYLLLEADPAQHLAIISLAHKNNLQHIRTKDYILVFRKTA